MPYAVSFALVTLLLGGGTVAFVLAVLPHRFALQEGLRESGASFPAKLPAFGPTAQAPLVRPAAPRRTPSPPAPGPAQLFWKRVLPLLHAKRWQEALPVFRSYLAAHPRDAGVLREYATTLEKAGRDGEAEKALRRLVRLTGRFEDRLALARLLRDRGRTDEAMALYGRLAAERPGDVALRLEMARALLWANRPAEAREVVAALPDSARASPAARALAGAIQTALAPRPQTAAAPRPSPRPPPTLLERARSAAAHDSLALASSLYAEAVRRHPDDAGAWKAWADLLELRLRDYAGAATALSRWLALTGADGAAHIRLARLESWAGQQDRARATLERLVARDPGRADAWAWLGDVRRFEGDRPGAAAAYRTAVALDPSDARARAGLAALSAERERLLTLREPRRAGPDVSLFLDSDHFRQLDASASGRARSGSLVLDGRAGYRLLHGRTLGGATAERTIDGAFADLEVARWWREATVRTSVSLGVENLPVEGTRPHWGAGLELPELGGLALSADYHHAPAYPLTRTLESVLQPVTSDQLTVSLFGAPGKAWTLQGTGDLVLLSAAPADNTRVAASVALRRRLASWLTVGYTSRWIGFTRAAPSVGGSGSAATGRRLYWDPRSFWSHELLLEAATPPSGGGWGAHLSLRPGLAFLDERGVAATTVPQLEVYAGVDRSGPWGSATASLFYGRAREGGYQSFGGQLGVHVRIP